VKIYDLHFLAFFCFHVSQAYSETSGIITMFYVVRGLSPYTEYEFHVIGVNNIGRGPPSAPVSTTTGETGPNIFF
jgi:Fibronectin type III domain